MLKQRQTELVSPQEPDLLNPRICPDCGGSCPPDVEVCEPCWETFLMGLEDRPKGNVENYEEWLSQKEQRSRRLRVIRAMRLN